MARPFENKTDEEVMCRGVLHAWSWVEKEEEDDLYRADIPGTVVVMQCDRCECLKYMKFSDVTGAMLAHPTMRYKEGYLLDKELRGDMGRGDLKNAARLEMLQRFQP